MYVCRGPKNSKLSIFLSLLRFDSELDKNGDASLDTEEILTWIIPTNEEIATDEVIIIE